MSSTTSSVPLQIPALRGVGNGKAFAAILAVSTLAFTFLFWLLYFKKAAGYTSNIVAALPAINAGLNSLSAVFLLFGFNAIRHRQIARHLKFMLSAFASSTLFLVCYIAYYYARGNTHFAGHGLVRPIYFSLLASHVLLSMIALPLILVSFFLSLAGQYPLHRKVSRFTFPIWLYVSVTGVLVFAMLKGWNG